MRVVMTVTREYEMDEARILAEPGFDPPAADAPVEVKQRWLEETFFELCGFQRDEDHFNGTLVVNTVEEGETEFDWPEALR